MNLFSLYEIIYPCANLQLGIELSNVYVGRLGQCERLFVSMWGWDGLVIYPGCTTPFAQWLLDRKECKQEENRRPYRMFQAKRWQIICLPENNALWRTWKLSRVYSTSSMTAGNSHHSPTRPWAKKSGREYRWMEKNANVLFLRPKIKLWRCLY